MIFLKWPVQSNMYQLLFFNVTFSYCYFWTGSYVSPTLMFSSVDYVLPSLPWNCSRRCWSEPESLLEKFSSILKGDWRKEGEVESPNYIPCLVKIWVVSEKTPPPILTIKSGWAEGKTVFSCVTCTLLLGLLWKHQFPLPTHCNRPVECFLGMTDAQKFI